MDKLNRRFFSPGFLDDSADFENYDDAAEELDESVISDFDPRVSMYDPKKKGVAATPQPRRRNAGIAASFDLTFTNTSAAPKGIELFNFLNSFIKKRRTDLTGVAAPFLYIPATSIEGALLAGGGMDGTVGFNQEGSLKILGGTAIAGVAPALVTEGADGAVTVSCSQTSYQSLWESSAVQPFRIKKIRMKVADPLQIDNEIVWRRKTVLGGQTQNSVNPRNFFRPEQFQSLIVDIPVGFTIDAESGIDYVVNNGETVKWNVQIEMYKRLTA